MGGILMLFQDLSSAKLRQLIKIRNARKYESTYRVDGWVAYRQFRGEKVRVGDRFTNYFIGHPEFSTRMNIFYSNVETLAATILPVMPKLVIEKRVVKTDTGELVSNKFYSLMALIVEKTLEYFVQKIKYEDFEMFKYDYLVTGRGVLWATYGKVDGKQSIHIERVPWNEFAIDPKNNFKDVKWVARRFFLNKGEFRKNFPDATIEKAHFMDFKMLLDQDEDPTLYNLEYTDDYFIDIWEYWDKDERKVYYLSERYDDEVIKTVKHEKSDFDDFFPTSNPLVSIKNGFSMIPRSEYWTYYHELAELSEISFRKSNLIRSIEAKSFTDSTNIDLVEKLAKAQEGYVVAVDNLNMQDGKNPIIYIDNESKQKVVASLNEESHTSMKNIYEITGLSEVMRQVSSEETATNARLRSKFGSARLQLRQRNVNNYILKTYEVALNLICRHFEWDTIEEITSIELRTRDDIDMERQEIFMAQQECIQEIDQVRAQFNLPFVDEWDPTSRSFQGVPEEYAKMKQMRMQEQMQQQQAMEQQQMMQEQQMQQQEMMAQQQQEGQEMNPEEANQMPEQQQEQQPQQPQPSPEQQQQAQQQQQQQQQQEQQKAQQRAQQLQVLVVKMQLRIDYLEDETSQEDVIEFLRDRQVSDFALEVDTDFEKQEEDPLIAQERMQYMDMFVKTLQGTLPIMKQDPASIDLMTNLLSSMLDGFKMSKSQRGRIEEYLSSMGENMKMQNKLNPNPPPPPDVMKAQADMMIAQVRQQEAQIKGQEVQMKGQIEQQKLQMSAQNANAGMNPQIEQMKAQVDYQKHQEKLQAEQTRAQNKAATDTNLMQMKIQADKERYQEKSRSDMIKARLQANAKHLTDTMKAGSAHVNEHIRALHRHKTEDMKARHAARQQYMQSQMDAQLQNPRKNATVPLEGDSEY
jgi:hypothetical protein